MIIENHIVWRSREDHSPLVTLVLETNKVLVHPYSVTKAQLGELAAAEAADVLRRDSAYLVRPSFVCRTHERRLAIDQRLPPLANNVSLLPIRRANQTVPPADERRRSFQNLWRIFCLQGG